MNTIHQNREEILELLAKGINAGVWEVDLKSRKAWWSDSYYKLLGYEPNEIEAHFGTFLDGLVYPDDRAVIIDATQKHFDERQPYCLEIRLKTKSGDYLWVETSGSAKWDEHGQPERMAGLIIDRHEQIVLRERLKLSEYLLNETGHLGKIGGWQFNVNTKETYMTQNTGSIYGFENTQQPEFCPHDKIQEKAGRFVLLEKLKETIENGNEYEAEYELPMADGTTKWIYAKGVPVFNNAEKVEYIKGVTQDITERKKKEEELKLSTQTIQEQNKRLLNFAHIVSHNLRSHSGNLIKVSEILANAEDEEERAEMIEFVGKLSRSLYETVSNLSDIVQIQTDLKIPKEELALDKIFSGVLGVLSPEIKEREATVFADFSRCPVVEYVPSYLESILLNFTTNALKYSQPGRNPVIKLVSKIVDGKKMLIIQDNGRGIDLEKHGDKLFGIYKTFHGNKDARGIGLFITRNQIEAMGGNIEVESQPGIGTTFTIRL